PERSISALPELLEEDVLVAALEVFGPDLVVFDTHAPMRVVHRMTAIGVRSVLVLRELRAEALRSFVASGAALGFDRIVRPHDPGEVDLTALTDAGAAALLVGPIVRPVHGCDSTESAGPLIVAMAGGGGQPVDAARYVRAVADAHLLARARVPNLET